MAEILELIMVLSFGLSWPVSIIKTLKSKTVAGKSPIFIALVSFGYVCGIVSKIISNNITYVFVFYCINLLMTLFDLSLNLYIRNKEKCEE